MNIQPGFTRSLQITHAIPTQDLPWHRQAALGIAAIALLLQVACAATAPQRPPAYTGPDNVSTVSTDMLIGSWNIRPLNPIPGDPNNVRDATMTFRPDGTAQSRASVDGDRGFQFDVEVSGVWQPNGEWFEANVADVEINQTAGPDIAPLLNLFKGQFRKSGTGRVNVMEADADRIVLLSAEGAAQELTRIK